MECRRPYWRLWYTMTAGVLGDCTPTGLRSCRGGADCKWGASIVGRSSSSIPTASGSGSFRNPSDTVLPTVPTSPPPLTVGEIGPPALNVPSEPVPTIGRDVDAAYSGSRSEGRAPAPSCGDMRTAPGVSFTFPLLSRDRAGWDACVPSFGDAIVSNWIKQRSGRLRGDGHVADSIVVCWAAGHRHRLGAHHRCAPFCGEVVHCLGKLIITMH